MSCDFHSHTLLLFTWNFKKADKATLLLFRVYSQKLIVNSHIEVSMPHILPVAIGQHDIKYIIIIAYYYYVSCVYVSQCLDKFKGYL